MNNFFAGLAAGTMTLIAGCASTSDIPAVDNFNIGKYTGTWHEIARGDHVFERGMTHVKAEYTILDDGRVKVVNSGIRSDGKEKHIEGIARLRKNANGKGELEVSFFGPFYGPYRIIDLDPEYRIAIVTSSSRNYIWILARDEKISSDELEKVVEKIRNWKFDVSKMTFAQ